MQLESVVYVAVNVNDRKKIKIGETGNSCLRNKQLQKEGYIIVKKFETYHYDDCRKFIESRIRAKWSNKAKVKRVKQDYFECSIEMAQKLVEDFDKYFFTSLKEYENTIESDY
jgi:hypothetical protein